jgi:hypothetical protein
VGVGPARGRGGLALDARPHERCPGRRGGRIYFEAITAFRLGRARALALLLLVLLVTVSVLQQQCFSRRITYEIS